MVRFGFCVLALLVGLGPSVASAQSVEGVWRVVELESSAGGGPCSPGTVAEVSIQPGFLILTDALLQPSVCDHGRATPCGEWVAV